MDISYTTLNCSTKFYEYHEDLYAQPGETDGPWCTCNTYYFESEENLDELIFLFFEEYLDDSEMTTPYDILDYNYKQKKSIMELICSRYQYDGDMAGSGAAMDPLFWVAHGAVERLFQRVIFENVLTDITYTLTSGKGYTCSGHGVNDTKAWLEGFYFEDASVNATNLTNAELMDILNPAGSYYSNYINFVYEDSSWSWCDGFDSWFNA
jgi:hypothetical protein